ncbi:MAG: hypothetical protein IJ189_06535 [Clostridia bacterium]|nr:hypothetical protein [Clostridia bacterium]
MNNKGGSSKVSKQKYDLWNRIITTRRNICQQLMIYDSKITKRTVFCLAKGPEHPKYELVLYDICSSLCWISKLMYNSDGEMKKLSAQQYNQRIFDGYAENADEVLLILERLPDCESILAVASDIFRKMQTVRLLWCHMIASTCERVYIEELAAAFEYVMCHEALPDPLYAYEGALFPCNYADFHWGKRCFF